MRPWSLLLNSQSRRRPQSRGIRDQGAERHVSREFFRRRGASPKSRDWLVSRCARWRAGSGCVNLPCTHTSIPSPPSTMRCSPRPAGPCLLTRSPGPIPTIPGRRCGTGAWPCGTSSFTIQPRVSCCSSGPSRDSNPAPPRTHSRRNSWRSIPICWPLQVLRIQPMSTSSRRSWAVYSLNRKPTNRAVTGGSGTWTPCSRCSSPTLTAESNLL
jgi:hypothetical protein